MWNDEVKAFIRKPRLYKRFLLIFTEFVLRNK